MTAALAGRVVVLVGVGAPGDTLSNGQATALGFARAGAKLVLADRDELALQACLYVYARQAGRLAQCRSTRRRRERWTGWSAPVLKPKARLTCCTTTSGWPMPPDPHYFG